MEEIDINSVYFRRMLLPLLQLQCRNDTAAAEVDLKRCTMEAWVAGNDAVEVSMPGIPLPIKVLSRVSQHPVNGTLKSTVVGIRACSFDLR